MIGKEREVFLLRFDKIDFFFLRFMCFICKMMRIIYGVNDVFGEVVVRKN